MAAPGGTSRASKLQALQSAMPVANQRAARGIQQAQSLQLQQAAAAAPATPQAGGYRAAQQQGADVTQAAGQAAVETAGQQLAKQAQVGELGLAEQARGERGRLAEQEMAARKEAADTDTRLAQLGESNKQQIWDSRIDFARNQANQKFLNQRQMADLAMTKAKDVEGFKDYQQQVQQGVEKRLQMMDIAFKKVSQALEQEYRKGKSQADRAQQEYLMQLKRDMEEAIARERESASKNALMWKAGGMALAAGITVASGGTLAPYAGAMVLGGGAAGEMGYSQFG